MNAVDICIGLYEFFKLISKFGRRKTGFGFKKSCKVIAVRKSGGFCRVFDIFTAVQEQFFNKIDFRFCDILFWRYSEFMLEFVAEVICGAIVNCGKLRYFNILIFYIFVYIIRNLRKFGAALVRERIKFPETFSLYTNRSRCTVLPQTAAELMN